jgi:hypothetical protein
MMKRMLFAGTLHYYCDDASLYDSAGHRMRHHGLRMLMASDDLYNSSSILMASDDLYHSSSMLMASDELYNSSSMRFVDGHQHEALNGRLLNGRLLKGGGGGDREDVTFCKGDDSLCEIPGEVCH